MALLQLNEDVLLLIFSKVDIDTLLSLHLVSKNCATFFQNHESTLCRGVALSAFPRCVTGPFSQSAALNIKWLNNLRFNHLAALLLEVVTLQEYPEKAVLAEDARGVDLRAKIVLGWKVLAGLSRIAKDVAAISEFELSAETEMNLSGFFCTRTVPPSPRRNPLIRTRPYELSAELDNVWRRESETPKRRLDFFKCLPGESRQGWFKMHHFLQTFWSDSFPSTHSRRAAEELGAWLGNAPHPQKSGEEYKHYLSWAAWFWLKQGPELLWQHWCGVPQQGLLRQRLSAAWNNTDCSTATIQAFCAFECKTEVRRVSVGNSPSCTLRTRSEGLKETLQNLASERKSEKQRREALGQSPPPELKRT